MALTRIYVSGIDWDIGGTRDFNLLDQFCIMNVDKFDCRIEIEGVEKTRVEEMKMIIWKQLFPMCFFMVHKLYTS
jgi:hypothetical protein